MQYAQVGSINGDAHIAFWQIFKYVPPDPSEKCIVVVPNCSGMGAFKFCIPTLSEQLAHSAVDLHLKEISEFLHGSEMNKNPTLP